MSETTNYQFPLYDSGDKPNLRDQYNGAMNALDTLLKGIDDDTDNLTQQVGQLSENVQSVQTALDAKAPINHASAATAYGVGNEANYGHVKLTSDFDNPAVGAAMSSSMLPRIMRQSRNVLFCGDSYSVEYDSVDQFYGIGHYLQSVYGTAWNVTNVSVAGTGFVSANGSSTFPTMINASSATDIDTVIIAGGINDMSQTETAIYNGAMSCINNAHTKWPGCQVFIIPMLYTWLLPTIDLRRVAWSVKRACMDAGATCIEGAWSWGLGHQSDWYIGPSSVHPNSTGAEAMARRIHNCVENNQVDAFNTINAASRYINVFYDHDSIRLTGMIDYGAKAQMPDYFQIGNPFNGNAGTATPNVITFGTGMNTMGHTGVLVYEASKRVLSMGGDVVSGESCYFDCVTNPWAWQFA